MWLSLTFFPFHSSCWQLSNCFLGAERISEGDVTQEHTYSERSPDLQDSELEKREALNFEKGISPNNFCPQKKNIQSICLNQSPETTVKKLTFGNKIFSPVLTEASLVRTLKLFHNYFNLHCSIQLPAVLCLSPFSNDFFFVNV